MLRVCIYVIIGIIGVFHRFIHFQSWATNISSPLHAETLSMLSQKQKNLRRSIYEPFKKPQKIGATWGSDSHQLYLQNFIPELQKSQKKCMKNTCFHGWQPPVPRSCISSWTRSPWGQCLSRSRPQGYTQLTTQISLDEKLVILGGQFLLSHEMPKFLFTAWGCLWFPLSTNKDMSKNNAKILHVKVQTHSENNWKKNHVQKKQINQHRKLKKKKKRYGWST